MIAAFKWPIIASLVMVTLVLGFAGPTAATTVVILAALELSLSVDNACVNARVLEKMSPVWQHRFLTWGILVAVFGMRALFPLLVVSMIAMISPWAALNMAFTDASKYGETLTSAHASVAGFGGMFLGMVFFSWVFEEREVDWLGFLERPMRKFGVLNSAAVIASSSILMVLALSAPEHERFAVLASGVIGILTYLLVNGVAGYFLGDDSSDNVARAGAALFVYIEVLDASFSFDGVIGAFAITSSFLLITAGTGIGAFFVRGLTVEMMRRKSLDTYAHLEHGAHWAIGALFVLLLLSVQVHIPEIVTGLVGASFLVAAVFSSIVRRNRLAVA